MLYESLHCVKSVQIRRFSCSEYGKYGPEKTQYLDTFHAVLISKFPANGLSIFSLTNIYSNLVHTKRGTRILLKRSFLQRFLFGIS